MAKAFENKLTANSGTYEVNDQALVTADFYAFELSEGAKIESFEVLKDGATTNENWVTLTAKMFKNPTSAKMGGLYFIPDNYTGKKLKLSEGSLKLFLR